MVTGPWGCPDILPGRHPVLVDHKISFDTHMVDVYLRPTCLPSFQCYCRKSGMRQHYLKVQNRTNTQHPQMSLFGLAGLFNEDQHSLILKVKGRLWWWPKRIDRCTARSDLFLEIRIVNCIQKCKEVPCQGWFTLLSQEGLSLSRVSSMDCAAAVSLLTSCCYGLPSRCPSASVG